MLHETGANLDSRCRNQRNGDSKRGKEYRGDSGFVDDTLLSTCLIGSPSRAHSRNEDILLPGTPHTQGRTLEEEPPSEVIRMLAKLKREVRDLKAMRSKQGVQNDGQVNIQKPILTKPPSSTHSSSPAREKLREIELMLAGTEESLQWLNERLSRVNTDNTL